MFPLYPRVPLAYGHLLLGCSQDWTTFWAVWSAWSRVCLVLFLIRHRQATLVAMKRTSVSPGGESAERRPSKWRRCGAPVNLVVFLWLVQRMNLGSLVTFIADYAGRMCRCQPTACTRSCASITERNISPEISVFVWRLPAGVCSISKATSWTTKRLHASAIAFWGVHRSLLWSKFCVWGGVMNWCISCCPSLLWLPVKWTWTWRGRGMRFWLVASFGTVQALIPVLSLFCF